MAKTKISEYSSTANNNTDINSINLAEGMAPSLVNNAIRTLMAQLKNFQDGSAGDSVTVGGNLSVTGTSTLTGSITATGGVSGAITSSSATITGGTITGITDLAVADGGTGASTAANARTNLGAAASGANSDITSITGLTTALTVAQGGTGVTTSTGTGNNVLSNSPTLVTPALGTPSALVGTNITGTASGLTAGNVTTNANLTGAVTSSGNATSLGSFSSANLLAALTDETGTGSAVFATSPTLVTPILGTPTSATLTNATGLPISTGVSGLGTGVATALAVNVGSSGAPLVNGGVLGTPSSGTATNLTGLPLSTGVTGTLPVANGGTGTATPSIVAGTNVTVTGTWPNQTIAASGGGGSGTVTSVAATVPSLFSISGSPITTSGTLAMTYSGTALPVANGGTGQTSYTDGQLLIGNSTGNTLTKATLTAGTNVTITNAAGAITIAASGGGASAATPTALGTVYGKTDTGSITFVGYQAGNASSSAGHNVAVGASAMAAITTGTRNIVLGSYAAAALTTGEGNVVLGTFGVGSGTNTFSANTSGSDNIAIGGKALNSNITANYSVAIGANALASSTGTTNSAFGSGAGALITTGTKNTIIGAYQGNSGGLDIRTASNYIVLSDGDGNPNISTADGLTVALKGAIPNTGTGITFPATQSASSNANTLDDYEEGTYTPTDASGAGLSFSSAGGFYTKIGRQVICFFYITFPSTASTAAVAIGSLPFTTGNNVAGGAFTGAIAYNTYGSFQLVGGSSVTFFNMSTPTGTDITNVNMSGKSVRGSFLYFV